MIGLDIGERRVGVAVSDPSGAVATPLKVLTGPLSADISPLRRIVEDYEPELLVIGLPVSLDGTEGPQAQRVRAEADRIGALLGLPVEFQDERFSSREAERVMAESGMNERQRRGSVDMVAASFLLQTYLDSTRSSREKDCT